MALRSRLLTVFLIVAAVIDAQTYNLATDFSTTVNPSGRWTYGRAPTFANQWQPINFVAHNRAIGNGWDTTQTNLFGQPYIKKNNGSSSIFGAAPGTVYVTPGCAASEWNIIEFKANVSGAYTFKIVWSEGDVSSVFAGVKSIADGVRNGTTVVDELFPEARASGDIGFNFTVTLQNNGIVQIGTGVYSTCQFTITPLSVIVTYTATAAPSPSTPAPNYSPPLPQCDGFGTPCNLVHYFKAQLEPCPIGDARNCYEAIEAANSILQACKPRLDECQVNAALCT